MAEQLSHYISEQIQAGVSTEKIKAALKTSGWKDEDVLAALSELKGESPDPAQPSKVWLYVGIALIVVALAGLGVVASMGLLGQNSNSVQLAPPSEVPVSQSAVQQPLGEEDLYERINELSTIDESDSSTQVISMGTDYTQLMVTLAEELPSCNQLEMSFTHFFDGQTHTKKIVGMFEKGCQYTETMPNGGRYECYFTAAQQAELSQAITDNIEAYTQGSGSADSESEHSDPWQRVYNDPQTCTLLGY